MTFLFAAPKLAVNAPFFARIFNPYRPELHYMRGPGPAWRAKHGMDAPIRLKPRNL